MTFAVAATMDEALQALAGGARPIAGGTDLVVSARHGKASLPTNLIAVDRVPELGLITTDNDRTIIGAAVTHATLMTHPTIVADYTAIADAAALVGSPSTRNVGTLGGNVMNGSPAMDTGAPLVALGATAQLSSVETDRSVALADLWLGPGQTSAASNELCTALQLPRPTVRSGSAYVRLEYRRAMEIAVVGAAAAVTLNEDHSVAALALALTAVAPTIVSVSGLDALVGSRITDAARATIASVASAQATPISDLRASDNYRRHTIGVMARRAVDAAVRRAQGETIAVPVNRTLGIGAGQ